MSLVSIYRDFFTFIDRLAGTGADPWSLYSSLYLDKHNAFLTAWWQQCIGKPEYVWQQRVADVKPEHYSGIRAMLTETDPEGDAAEALRRCLALLPGGEPIIQLMIGFFSPDGFTIKVEDEWQIGLGLERLGEVRRIPILVAHEFAHWYRRSHGLPTPVTLGERLIEEGLATHLSLLAYPERPLADHLFITETRLRAFQDYKESLLAAVWRDLNNTDEDEIQRSLYAWPGTQGDSNLFAGKRGGGGEVRRLPSPVAPDAPPRPGGYLGYEMVRRYLERHSEMTLREMMSMLADQISKEGVR